MSSSSVRYPRGLNAAAHLVGGWLNLMSGGLSVPFGLWALFHQGEERIIFALLAFATLIFFSYTLVGQLLKLEEQCRPKLKVEAGHKVDGSITLHQWQEHHGNVMIPLPVCFYRLKVTPTSIGAVTECKAYLTRIDRDGVKRWGGDDAPLTFAPGEAEDALCKTIEDKSEKFIDVLAVTSNGAIHVGTKNRHWRYLERLHTIFDSPGTYLLTVLVTSPDTVTSRVRLAFEWSGTWNASGWRIHDGPPEG